VIEGVFPHPKCIPVRDESDVVMTRKWTRELALREGMPANLAEALVTAVSEISRNVVVHAGSGEMFLGILHDAGRRAIGVVVRDGGRGIADTELAMRDGYSTAGGLGLGLSSARRLVGEFQLVSQIGAGTTVILKQWFP
jgi:serine/threonine-protein kinase RsbT